MNIQFGRQSCETWKFGLRISKLNWKNKSPEALRGQCKQRVTINLIPKFTNIREA